MELEHEDGEKTHMHSCEKNIYTVNNKLRAYNRWNWCGRWIGRGLGDWRRNKRYQRHYKSLPLWSTQFYQSKYYLQPTQQTKKMLHLDQATLMESRLDVSNPLECDTGKKIRIAHSTNKTRSSRTSATYTVQKRTTRIRVMSLVISMTWVAFELNQINS